MGKRGFFAFCGLAIPRIFIPGDGRKPMRDSNGGERCYLA